MEFTKDELIIINIIEKELNAKFQKFIGKGRKEAEFLLKEEMEYILIEGRLNL